jgi:phosphoglycolate phosphatase-like HAD superfamily hydrolase
MLIFDFDGVLMDSVREIAVTAYNTLKGDIVTKLNQVPKGALELFLRNRFHVQPIGDALTLMNWSLQTAESDPQKLLTPQEYDLILQQIDEPVARRTRRFFEMRGRFKKKDMKAWLELNAPVQPLWRLLIEKRRAGLVMLTNKNREATIDLCSHFGLSISKDDVYSADNGASKVDNMKQIMQRFKESKYSFIEDSVKNLREIDEYFNRGKKIIELIFATWGYTGPDDARSAESFGYQVLTMDEFMRSL